MYHYTEIENAEKHDYDRSAAEHFAAWGRSFSINIFQWKMKPNGKGMKRSACVVRVKSWASIKEKAFEMADSIVKKLDSGTWDGRKTVTVK